MMARNEHPPCAAELRKTYGGAVSTVPPSRWARSCVCPHDIEYWVARRGSTTLPRWARRTLATAGLLVWFAFTTAAAGGVFALAAFLRCGVWVASGSGLIALVTAVVCTWPVLDELSWWCEGPEDGTP